MRKFKYVVSISYHEFEFDSMGAASAFANIAAIHITKEKTRVKIEVEEYETEDDLKDDIPFFNEEDPEDEG